MADFNISAQRNLAVWAVSSADLTSAIEWKGIAVADLNDSTKRDLAVWAAGHEHIENFLEELKAEATSVWNKVHGHSAEDQSADNKAAEGDEAAEAPAAEQADVAAGEQPADDAHDESTPSVPVTDSSAPVDSAPQPGPSSAA